MFDRISILKIFSEKFSKILKNLETLENLTTISIEIQLFRFSIFRDFRDFRDFPIFRFFFGKFSKNIFKIDFRTNISNLFALFFFINPSNFPEVSENDGHKSRARNAGALENETWGWAISYSKSITFIMEK